MKDRVLFWNMVALVALALGCLLFGWLSPGASILGPWFIAWILFGYVAAVMAIVQFVVALTRFLWKDDDARSWLLATLITAVVGPGLCGVSGTAASVLG